MNAVQQRPRRTGSPHARLLDPSLLVEGTSGPRRFALGAAFIAASIAVFGRIVDWRGGDLSAQLFRVDFYRQHGLTLWNPQWYGGHFTLSYSVLYPPLAATFGIVAMTIVSAALSAWCFARLLPIWFGPRARVGMVLFALGTGSQVAIGQLPFLLGESIALAALLAAVRQRWWLSALCGLLATMASPLAGAFLLLVLSAWILTAPAHRWARIGFGAATLAPLAATSVMFPGTGMFPYPSRDAMGELLMVVVLIVAVTRGHRALRVGGLLYVAAIAASYFLHTPMGGNVSRLAESVALPIAACVLWPTRRLLFAVVLVPMLLWQWVPAAPAILDPDDDLSTNVAYYEPLLGFFAAQPTAPSRVEVVPTRSHYEVAYVAPAVPLARGWERQVDTAENAIFYDPTLFDATSFRQWLLNTGVQYVALADAPLDYAAVTEGALVRQGFPGITEVWRSQHWTVYAVDNSPGLIDGEASIVSASGDEMIVNVTAPGTVRVRVRYNRNWDIDPEPVCFGSDESGWITFTSETVGEYRLRVELIAPPANSCTGK